MTAQLFYLPFPVAFSSNGFPVAGALANFYLTNTSTRAPVYSDSGLSVPLANPVPADGAGRFPQIYLDGTVTYRVVVTDPLGATLGNPVDPYIPGTIVGGAAGDKGDTGAPGSGNLIGFSVDDFCTTNTAAGNTAGFALLVAAVQAAGGGVIDFTPGKTYVIGAQTLVGSGTYLFEPSALLKLTGLTRGLVIRGNGAKLQYAAGLKFGVFDSSGNVVNHSLPNWSDRIAAPTLDGMIALYNCTAPIHIENLELDGNAANLTLGGRYGDDGWQIPGDGLFLSGNTGGIYVENVNSHDMPRDGSQIVDTVTLSTRNSRGTFVNCNFKMNARQGLSIVGGKGYTFIGCSFNDTGKGSFRSSPAAGVDMEQETGIIRNISYRNCELANNDGVGALTVGDVADITFDGCRFIGTTTWTIYGLAQSIVRKCLIVGNFVNCANMVFEDCRIVNDTAYSTTGAVYLGSGWIPDFGGGAPGVVFERCIWDMTGTARGPTTTNVTYRNCTINVAATQDNFTSPYGRFEGTNVLNAILNGVGAVAYGTIVGSLSVAGVPQKQGSKTYDPPSIAAGASTSTTVTCPGAALGDVAEASFSADQLGVTFSAYVSAADTVTVYLTNKTGGAVDLASGTLYVRTRIRNP